MKIDLRKLPVFLISPGTGKYEHRVNEVMKRLSALGFEKVTHIQSVPDSNNTDSLTRTNLELMRNNTELTPFIILEDDCGFTESPLEIDIPADTDALYLGISKWVYPHAFETLGRGYHIRENQSQDFQEHPEYPNLVKLTATTSTHGIVFFSRQYLEAFMEHMNKVLPNHTPHDLVFATLQRHYNVYALKNPLVYQDATLGGQEAVTRLTFTPAGFR